MIRVWTECQAILLLPKYCNKNKRMLEQRQKISNKCVVMTPQDTDRSTSFAPL